MDTDRLLEGSDILFRVWSMGRMAELEVGFNSICMTQTLLFMCLFTKLPHIMNLTYE